MNWFLYDQKVPHDRVNYSRKKVTVITLTLTKKLLSLITKYLQPLTVRSQQKITLL